MRAGRTDSGETLLELMITVAILGLAGVAIISGLGTAVGVSGAHRKQSTAGATVRSFAEAIESSVLNNGYVATCTPGYASGFTSPTGFTTPQITAVSFWTGSAFQTTCDPADDRGVQRLTLQVSSMDGRATEQLVLVVRKPCGVGSVCP
jgi:Tfp pilus assembly protein PilE